MIKLFVKLGIMIVAMAALVAMDYAERHGQPDIEFTAWWAWCIIVPAVILAGAALFKEK